MTNGDMFMVLLAFIGLCACIVRQAIYDLKNILLQITTILNRLLFIRKKEAKEDD